MRPRNNYAFSVPTLFVNLSLCLLVGCASTPKRSNAADQSGAPTELKIDREKAQESPDGREFLAIDANYRERKFEYLIQRSKAFLKQYSSSSYLDQVHNLKGLAHITLKQHAQATEELKKVIEITDQEYLKGMASYNLAYVYFEQGQIDQASKYLDDIKTANLEKPDRMKLFTLRAKVARLKQNYPGAAYEILSALKSHPDPRSASAEPMYNFLDEVLEPINNIISLDRLLEDFDDTPASDRLLFKVANYYFSNGDRDKARKYYEKIVNDFPESKHFAASRDRIRKVEFQGATDPRRIGVLLTLSGKFGKFGYKALQGLELALKIFQPQSDPAPITLVVLDDQGEVDRALGALEELFYKHQVSAVVGPLVSKLAEPVGRKAQELGVPLIALTQKEAVGGDFVFNAALTPAMQVRELVRYATEKANVKNFSILSPASKFGEEYVKYFWDEIDRVQGSIRGCETYPADETDFRLYIDKMVGLSQTDARSHEVEELKLLKAATPVKNKSKKFDRMFDLKPIVDFEAVFIPDEPKSLGQILPTFAYRDIEKVLFLGINTWNSQELIARSGEFAQGAVFVDGFFAGSENPTSKKFIEEYRQTFNAEPSLVEALAYDAGHILASLLKNGDVRSRSDLRDRILALRDFPGVAGKISYQAGRLTKRLSLLTVKNGKIEEIAQH